MKILKADSKFNHQSTGFEQEKLHECLLLSKLFSGLTKEELADVIPLLNAKIKQCKRGTILVSTGNIVTDIGIVLQGRLTVSKEDAYGDLNLIRNTVPFELFAADIACTPTKVSPIVISCTTEATILTFPYRMIAEKGAIPPPIRCILLKNIVEIISNENMRQLYKIDILSRRSLRDRIVLYLSNQAKRTTGVLSLPFNREELANYLCVDRSALSRELSRMQQDGLIRFKKNQFQITDHISDPI